MQMIIGPIEPNSRNSHGLAQRLVADAVFRADRLHEFEVCPMHRDRCLEPGRRMSRRFSHQRHMRTIAAFFGHKAQWPRGSVQVFHQIGKRRA